MTIGYREIAAALRADIVNGVLPPGSAVPSYRALAAQFGTNHSTVADAVKSLATEGWVIVAQGQATRVVEDLPTGLPTVRSLADQLAEQGRRLEAHEERIAELERRDLLAPGE